MISENLPKVDAQEIKFTGVRGGCIMNSCSRGEKIIVVCEELKYKYLLQWGIAKYVSATVTINLISQGGGYFIPSIATRGEKL